MGTRHTKGGRTDPPRRIFVNEFEAADMFGVGNCFFRRNIAPHLKVYAFSARCVRWSVLEIEELAERISRGDVVIGRIEEGKAE